MSLTITNIQDLISQEQKHCQQNPVYTMSTINNTHTH